MIFSLIPPRWNYTEICSENKRGCGIRAEIKEARRRGNRPLPEEEGKEIWEWEGGIRLGTGTGYDMLVLERHLIPWKIFAWGMSSAWKREEKEKERVVEKCREGSETIKWPIMTNFQINVQGKEGEGRRSLGRATWNVIISTRNGQTNLSSGLSSCPPPPAVSSSFSAAFILSHAAAAALGARLHLASFNDAPNVSHVLIAIT